MQINMPAHMARGHKRGWCWICGKVYGTENPKVLERYLRRRKIWVGQMLEAFAEYQRTQE